MLTYTVQTTKKQTYVLTESDIERTNKICNFKLVDKFLFLCMLMKLDVIFFQYEMCVQKNSTFSYVFEVSTCISI
jgi:hypothetical protein